MLARVARLNAGASKIYDRVVSRLRQFASRSAGGKFAELLVDLAFQCFDAGQWR